MKIALAAMATAVAALVVVLTNAAREAHLSERFSAGRVAASASGSPRPAPDPVPIPVQGNTPSQQQAATPLPGSEPVSSDALDAGAAAPATAVLSVSSDAPDAGAADAATALPSRSSGEQVAALRQLVTQAQQESEQLGHIDYDLLALRQQAAYEAWRRQEEAQQMAAQHAATLEALGTLRQAEALLAFGNSDGVDEQLARAEWALSGRTLLDVEAAREALSRSDLYPARQYLAAALAERRVPR
jgi:hypothetical protein